MNFLTRYRLRKALIEIQPKQEKKNLMQRIKPFLVVLKYSVFTPILFIFKKFSNWLNKQHKGTIVLVVITILIFAFFVFNQLRYHYWLNIMHTEYPEDVLVALDKVLIQWNARVNAGFFLMFNMLMMIGLAIANHIYNSDEVQTIPGTFKLK